MGDTFSISRRRLLQAGAALGGAMLLPGNQLIAHRRPAGLLARDEGDAVLFIESLQGSDG